MRNIKFVLIQTILIIVMGIIVCVLVNPDIGNKIELGDQVAIFNSIDENGNEIDSVVAIYNSDFSKLKTVVELDDIFFSIDQLNWSKAKGIGSEAKFRVYNNDDYQDVVLNMEDNSMRSLPIVQKRYQGDSKVELNVYSNGDFELTKDDLYMKVNDPNLNIDGDYYSLSDVTQFTNYMS